MWVPAVPLARCPRETGLCREDRAQHHLPAPFAVLLAIKLREAQSPALMLVHLFFLLSERKMT